MFFIYVKLNMHFFQGPFGPVGQKGQVSYVIVFICILLLVRSCTST